MGEPWGAGGSASHGIVAYLLAVIDRSSCRNKAIDDLVVVYMASYIYTYSMVICVCMMAFDIDRSWKKDDRSIDRCRKLETTNM